MKKFIETQLLINSVAHSKSFKVLKVQSFISERMNSFVHVLSHCHRSYASCQKVIHNVLALQQQRRHSVHNSGSDYAYTVEFQESVADTIREKFWAKKADAISWFHKPTSSILSFPRDEQLPIRPQWFVQKFIFILLKDQCLIFFIKVQLL